MAKGPELVEELREILMEELSDEPLVVSVLDTLCSYLGGRQVYFPQNNMGVVQIRDAMMLSDNQNGMNITDLVTKYRMSEISIRRALKREKDRMRRK